MKVKWKKNDRLKPQVLMDKLKGIATVNVDGQVSYSAFEKQEIDSVILTMLEFDEEFSSSTIQKTYLEAQAECVKNQSFSKDCFLSALNSAVVRHIARPEKSYVMVTSISIDGGFPIKRFDTSKSTIRCYPKGLPKKYSGRLSHAWDHDSEALPSHYCPVTVTVKSKDKMDAFRLALYELDFFRGIHSLLINPHAEMNFGRVSQSSLNRVMLGGLHSLHDLDGKIVDESLYWYERPYEVLKFRPLKKREAIAKASRSLVKKLSLHSEGYKIKAAIVRYVRAYDETDRNIVIQKLWATLESLVSPSENNTALIVRRCSFMFDEREYHAQILEHLKEYRNRYVHTGYEVDNLDYHCYQLQMFFRQAVLFYLGNYKIFSTLSKANAFLDLPSGFDELMHLKRSVIKALKYQGHYDSDG